MATKVHMEALSPTMEEGQLVKWLKAEGDSVANGDVLAEIETDKATMELVARGTGVLRKILLSEGETAPVGEVIAVIAAEDEDISELVDAAAEAEPRKEAPEPKSDKDEEAEEAEEEAAREEEAVAEGEESPAEEEGETAERERPAAEPRGEAERVKASPLARRLAEEGGIELSSIEGSGPGGRVVKRDVEAALEKRATAPASAPGVPEEEYEDVPLSQMRKTIAKRLVQSIGPVPHFFLTIEVDMGRAMEARQRVNELVEGDGDKVSLNDFVIRTTAAALRRHPECNAHWNEDSIRRFNRVHVGVAVAVEDGLITPVVRDADRKGVVQISREVKELAGRAREKKLKPEEYTGATFSISNLGMFGIHEFTAVINPPEAGILAVGRVEETPVVEEGEVVVRPRMRVTMSCDHRVIDGATGARFLQTLKAMLEDPGVALL